MSDEMITDNQSSDVVKVSKMIGMREPVKIVTGTKSELEELNAYYKSNQLIIEQDTGIMKFGRDTVEYKKLPRILTGYVSTEEPDNDLGVDGDLWVKIPTPTSSSNT